MIEVIGTSSTMKLLKPEKRVEQHRKSAINVPGNLNLHGSKSEGPKEPESSLQSQKKTRDLPNLNKCHACGCIVDDGKKRLHILNSEWRIVLLCKNCFSSIKASKMCTYCFSESSADCYRCEQCQHSVHKKCFSKYKYTPPWSYAFSGSEFSVCVDCWVPQSVALSRKRMKTEKIKKKGGVVLEKEASRVSDDGDSAVSLEDMVKDANLVLKKKVEAAARAREEAVNKAEVARRAVVVANSALCLVGSGDENGLNERFKVSSGKVLELCPSLSSSPSSCSPDTPKVGTSSSDSPWEMSNESNSSDFLKHEISSDDNMYRNSHKYVLKPLVCMDGSDKRSSSKEGKCMTDFDSKVDVGEELMKEEEGSCSDKQINLNEYNRLNVDHKLTDTALPGEERRNRLPDRFFLKYNRLNLVHKRKAAALPGEERCNGQSDRFCLKYCRRVDRSKPISVSEPKILYNNYETNLESQGSATEVPSNCSWELRTSSNG